MSCTQYDEVFTDLACGAPTDAAARDRAVAHAEGCRRCAARLARERALSDGLGALADSAARAEAPPRVKAAALAAFRAHAAEVAASPPAPWWRRQPLLLAVAATLVLAAATTGLWLAGRTGTPAPASNRPIANDVPKTDDNEPRDVNPRPVDTPPANDIASDAPVRHHKRHTTLPRPARTEVAVAATETASTQTETVTDYIPLTYLDDETAIRSGHVVRVEVSRDTLVLFGLGADVSGGGDTVKADVVIGDDGVARAIRFVR